MKISGVLNGPINARISTLGHGHLVMVTDCGMPLPDSAAVVDLALIKGIPTFSQVLKAVLADVQIEGSIIATDALGTSVEASVRAEGLVPETISHEDLQGLLAVARLIIRTGEATPFANVALRCGVTF